MAAADKRVRGRSHAKKGGRLLQFAVFLVVAAYAVYSRPFWVDSIAGGWENCISYAGMGELYGGQPYCSKGPLIYYFGLCVGAVFGMGRLWLGMALVKVVLFAAVFGLMRRLVVGGGGLFFDASLFMLAFYPYGADRPDNLFAAAFFLAGFYALTLRDFRGREYVAGLFYAVSLLFKYVSAYPIALSLLFLFRERLGGGLSVAVSGVLKAAAPILVAFGLAYMVYPLFLTYSVWAHMLDPELGYFDAFRVSFFSWNVHILALYVFVLAGLYLLSSVRLNPLEGKMVVFPLICIPLTALSLTRGSGVLSLADSYALPVYPLLIVSAHAFKRHSRRLFAVFLAVVLCYPGLGGGLASDARVNAFGDDALQNLVRSGMSVLPPSRRGLLFESGGDVVSEIEAHGAEEHFKKFGWGVFGQNNTFLHPGGEYLGGEDPFWAPRLRRLVDIPVDFSANSSILSPQEELVKGQILGGRYDAIMYTPNSWAIITRILFSMPDGRLRGYCEIKVPDFLLHGRGRDYSVVIFANGSVCKGAAKEMAEYYVRTFEAVCGESRAAAEVVKAVNAKNGFLISKRCLTPPEPAGYDAGRANVWDFVGAASLAVGAYLLAGKKKS